MVCADPCVYVRSVAFRFVVVFPVAAVHLAGLGWWGQPAGGAESSAETAVSSAVEAAPLVANPGFESVSDAQVAERWGANPAVYSRDQQVRRSGSASLRYKNDDPNRYSLCSQKVDWKPGAKYRFSVWVKTQNIEGEDSGATICVEWCDAEGKWLGGRYPSGVRGNSDWRRVEGVARVPENVTRVTLKCYVRKGMTGTAWFDDVCVERIVDPPLRTNLLAPLYRGRIDAHQPREIRLRARLNLVDYDVAPGELRLAVRLVDESGQAHHKAEVRWGAGEDAEHVDATLPARDLPEGRYELVATLHGPDGEPLDEHRHSIHRVPDDFKPTCYIDAHRRLIVEGEPFFPLGMYFGGVKEDDLATFADSRFNCLMAYGSPTAQQMDVIHRHGLKVIYSIKDFYAGSRWCPGFIKSEADEEPAVRQRVRMARDHPALLAWYLNDELPLSYVPRLEAHQRWVAEEDPDHPTWVVLYQYNQVAEYLRTFDVIGTDPYPIGRKPPSMAAEWTAEVVRQVDRARPIWQVPQVFNWGNYRADDAGAENHRSPTAAEMRSMAWQCICEGATGLVFYSFYDLKRNSDVPFEEQWSRLKQVVAEIDRFAPVLLSIESVPQVELELLGEAGPNAETGGPNASASAQWLHWTTRMEGGKLYLFVANDGDGGGSVRVRFPWESVAVRQVAPTEAGEAVRSPGHLLIDSEPLEVRAYEIAPKR